MWAASTTSTLSIGAAVLMPCSARTTQPQMLSRNGGMSGREGTRFNAGLVQMRSGLSPQANLDAAVRLISEARAAGADYVLTPEMTNILELKRDRLFTRSEEHTSELQSPDHLVC